MNWSISHVIVSFAFCAFRFPPYCQPQVKPIFPPEIAQLCPIFDVSSFSFSLKVGNLPIKILEFCNSFPKREDVRRKSG